MFPVMSCQIPVSILHDALFSTIDNLSDMLCGDVNVLSGVVSDYVSTLNDGLSGMSMFSLMSCMTI